MFSGLIFSGVFLITFLFFVFLVRKAGSPLFSTLPLIDLGGNNPFFTHLKGLYYRLLMDIDILLGWGLGLFALFGLFLLFLEKQPRRRLAFFGLGLLLFVSLAFFKPNPLYSFALILFYVPLAVYPITSGAGGRLLRGRFTWLLPLLFAGATLFTFFRNLDRISAISQGEPRHLMDIANWIIHETPKESRILSERPLLPERTGRHPLALPDSITSFPLLLEYARQAGADYLLADYPEYNRRPYLRFLSDPAMVRPLGLSQMVRSGQSALFRIEQHPVAAGDGTLFLSSYPLEWKTRALTNRAALLRFIKTAFPIDPMTALPPPRYQAMASVQGQGFILTPLLLSGPFGEVIPANLYLPDRGSEHSNQGIAAAILLLSGNHAEGKTLPVSVNLAENFARRGCAVLAFDNAGTGERIGAGFSHSAAAVQTLADGFAPAFYPLSEAVSSLDYLNQVAGGVSPKAVVALDQDAYTALYASLLDSTIQAVLYVNGPTSFDDLILRPEIPLQSLVPGLAGLSSMENLLSATATPNRFYLALSPDQNGWMTHLAAQTKGIAFTANNSDSLIQFVLPSALDGFLQSFALSDNIRPTYPIRFRPLSEQDVRSHVVIGSENLASVSPPLLATLSEINRQFKPDTSVFHAAFRVVGKEMDPSYDKLPSPPGFAVRQGVFNPRDPVSGGWIEVRRERMAAAGVLVLEKIAFNDSLLSSDTGLIAIALKKGMTVCFFPWADMENRGVRLSRQMISNAFYGVPSARLYFNRLVRLKQEYGAALCFVASDAAAGQVASFLLDQDSTLFRQVLLDTTAAQNLEQEAADPYNGYDGREGYSSIHYSPVRMRWLMARLAFPEGVEGGLSDRWPHKTIFSADSLFY
ncbi:MAG: hypothetical protein A2293_02760 [Elusimicrobia bacterium RIFOXYB2_FULL_49_7]|nr:MAG: hypothetical protein A2293_02760 [Elusimicrobia bacterium RIFOXYB2_FULL_49_7]